MPETLSTDESSQHIVYRCFQCATGLVVEAEGVRCPACDSEWPIREGIPVFADAPYWGEIPQAEMQAFNKKATASGWREALASTFADKPDYVTYITDINRSTWVNALPVSPDATVLDVGSGLGAIAHGLALTYKKVVSVEGVAERVQFQKIRFAQEKLTNVELAQGSVLDLPFFPETFDLIVLNGVVEWIGEWDTAGTPREAQVRALEKVFELLKPGGVLLVGIENHWGYNSFFGRTDHSGLSYTQLMPRWLATMRLRRKGFKHYRTELNERAEYRTYTYGEGGYRKLLADAGFDVEDVYYPSPGYNLPYRFYSALNPAPFSRLIARGIAWGSVRYAKPPLRQRMKFALAESNLLARFPLDFLLVGRRPPGVPSGVPPGVTSDGSGEATPDAHRAPSLPAAIAERLKDESRGPLRVYGLESTAQRNKRVVLMTDRPDRPSWVAKTSMRRLPHEKRLGDEERVLLLLREILGDTTFANAAPRLVARFDHGPWEVLLESAVEGTPLDYELVSRLLRGKNVFALIERVTAWILGLGRALNDGQDVDLPGWSWAGEFDPLVKGIPDFEARLARLPSWIQHGDLFVSNIYWDEANDGLQAIDWEDLGGGYPPLFDLFSFWTTSWDVDLWGSSRGEPTEIGRFEELYFAEGDVSRLMHQLGARACSVAGIEARELVVAFAAYLLVYIEKLKRRGSQATMERYRARLEYLVENRERFVLG
jgi:SAM-dependent methyltransferase